MFLLGVMCHVRGSALTMRAEVILSFCSESTQEIDVPHLLVAALTIACTSLLSRPSLLAGVIESDLEFARRSRSCRTDASGSSGRLPVQRDYFLDVATAVRPVPVAIGVQHPPRKRPKPLGIAISPDHPGDLLEDLLANVCPFVSKGILRWISRHRFHPAERMSCQQVGDILELSRRHRLLVFVRPMHLVDLAPGGLFLRCREAIPPIPSRPARRARSVLLLAHACLTCAFASRQWAPHCSDR